MRTFGSLTFVLALLGALPVAQAGETTRVSVSSAGVEGDGNCSRPSISATGRFVAFHSFASNLVSDDNNGASDVFVHDRKTGQTTRVSVDSDGVEGNGASNTPSISANGRFVAFRSGASNLVPNDGNGEPDIFVHDRKTGQTTRVSVNSGGAEGNATSFEPSISPNGRFVAYHSSASNLVTGDGNGASDVFVHDRKTGKTTRVSVDSAGVEGNSDSYNPSLSATGRFVALLSHATNLVPNDSNVSPDAFVHDRKTGKTTRVSVNSTANQGNGPSSSPTISANGRFVVFPSDASNLVAEDGNGDEDVFVHDRKTGKTTRLSLDSAGVEGNDYSFDPSISANGRIVAFWSFASNLVSDDINERDDIFAHDRKTGQTTRVSVDSLGVEGNSDSFYPSISAKGRFVAFRSRATNLVPNDGNRNDDIFVHDRK